MIFEPGTSEEFTCTLPRTKTADKYPPKAKIVRQVLIAVLLVVVR